MLLIKWKLLSSLNFISLASLSSPLSLSLAYRWNLKSSYGVLTRKIRGIIVTINLRLLLGAPNIFVGAPATWVKWLKCHSPFHIKNAQWLVRTSHCSFSTSRTLFLLPNCFFSLFFARDGWLFVVTGCGFSSCCDGFVLLIAFEVSESASSCGVSSSLLWRFWLVFCR